MEGTRSNVPKDRKRRTHEEDGHSIHAWLFATVVYTLLFAVAYLPEYKLLQIPREFLLFVFGSVWSIRAALLFVFVSHVGEATYGWNLAKKVDPQNAQVWLLRTFVFGFLSLLPLWKKARVARKDM